MPRWEPPSAPPPGQPHQPPPPQGGGGQPLPAAAPEVPYGGPQSSGYATGSLICGIAGLATVCFCPPVSPVLGITAVVLGTRANRAVRASAGSETGTGTATAGVVTGLIALVLSVLVLAAIVAVIILGLAGAQQHVIFRSICTGSGC